MNSSTLRTLFANHQGSIVLAGDYAGNAVRIFRYDEYGIPQSGDAAALTPANGARVVARAWADPAFRERLLKDANSACAELGYPLPTTHLIALENTQKVHHVVVCTLCSCYPRELLGMPPAWYKSRAYRARIVREPRAVLDEFGLSLPDDAELRVRDSTADLRYLVVPRRPEGTAGMSEDELVALITRDSMIGVAQARAPGH